MTVKEYYEYFKNALNVKLCREDEVREKYAKFGNFDELIAKAKKTDYANDILAKPLFEIMTEEEKAVFKNTLITKLPLMSVNAKCYKAEDGYFVVINERLMGLISAYNEISFLEAEKVDQGASEDGFANHFAPVLESYVTPNSGNILPIYKVEDFPEGMFALLSEVTVAQERFILAHELAHIYLGHLENLPVTKSFASENLKYGSSPTDMREMELAADRQATIWLAKLVKARGGLSLYWYLQLFMLLNLIECNLGFPDEKSSHPSALVRILKLRLDCKDCFSDEDISLLDEMIYNSLFVDTYKINVE